MSDWFSQPPAEQVRPDYNVWYYIDGIYKIVNFKSTLPRLAPPVRQETPKYDTKLAPSLSRTRKLVFEYGLCNDWSYFCTFTLDKEKYDRFNLEKFKKDLSQFVLDQRKKYRKKGFDLDLRYLFIPELHEDGAWHMHGLVSDVSCALVPFADELAKGKNVPIKLARNGYFDWPDYNRKFGFCSLDLIRDKVKISKYITKYIYKSIDDSAVPVGARMLCKNNGLNKAVLHGDIYGYCGAVHKFLTEDYEFCRVGMTKVEDDLPWFWCLEYMPHLVQPWDNDYSAEDDTEDEVDRYWTYTQAAIDGFKEVTYDA